MSDDPKWGDLFIIFDGPPGPEGGRFVEVEDARGRGIYAAPWEKREDGYWALGPFRRPPKKEDPDAS